MPLCLWSDFSFTNHCLHRAFSLLANLAAGTIPAQIGKLTRLQSLQLNGGYDVNIGEWVFMKLSGKCQFERIYHMPRRVIGEIQLLLA